MAAENSALFVQFFNHMALHIVSRAHILINKIEPFNVITNKLLKLACHYLPILSNCHLPH